MVEATRFERATSASRTELLMWYLMGMAFYRRFCYVPNGLWQCSVRCIRVVRVGIWYGMWSEKLLRAEEIGGFLCLGELLYCSLGWGVCQVICRGLRCQNLRGCKQRIGGGWIALWENPEMGIYYTKLLRNSDLGIFSSKISADLW